MITDADKLRLKNLFSDTISLLCRSGLPGACALRVDALIGVTLDDQQVVLVNFSENFWPESENGTRVQIDGEKNPDMQSSQMSEKSNTLSLVSYGVKDEFETGSNLALCPDETDGSNCTSSALHSSFHDPAGSVEQQNKQYMNVDHDSSRIGSRNPIPVTEPEKTSVLESDSDYLLIKTEPGDSDVEMNRTPAESETLIASPADLPLVPTVNRSLYSSSPLRIKHVQSMQRRTWRNAKFYRSCHQQTRCNTVKRGASYMSQVSSFGSDPSSLMPLNNDDVMPEHLPPFLDADKFPVRVREQVQCNMCGSWLRGRQTLNEHIRGMHLSIHCYHCKHCGLSFKWRSAQRRHQLNCPASQSIA